MEQTNAKPPRQLAWLEQVAVLATSLIWTVIVLLIISFVWAYQDIQAHWETSQQQITAIPVAVYPVDISQPGGAPALLPSETATLTPSPTATPAPTDSPTPTATPVMEPAEVPPEILPETPLDGEGPAIAPDDGETTTEPSPPPTNTPASPTNTPVPPTNTPTPVTETPPTNTPVPAPPPPPADSGPTQLVIKSVGIDTPVIPVGWSVVEQNGRQYSVWDVANYAAGWHNTSALPGQSGNTVLSGHHNIKGEVFRYLVDVQEGDEVDLYVGDTLYQYYVEQTLIVKEKGEPLEVRRQNAQWIAQTNDIRLTLVTCWPYTNNTHRVIVVARPRS